MVVIDSTQVHAVQLVVSFDEKFQKFNYRTLMKAHLTANQSAKKLVLLKTRFSLFLASGVFTCYP